MIILRYSQNYLEANTYLIAHDELRSALVVDPGAGSRFWVKEMLERYSLTLGAVLLTHGHADHVWDVSAIVDDEPVYIPAPDLYRLEDPLAQLSGNIPGAALALSRMGVTQWKKPQNLLPLPGVTYEQALEIVPGVVLRAVPAPGHTEGSTVFLFDGRSTLHEDGAVGLTERDEHFMLSGDVIFNGGIGRTDLPGGDEQKMAASLRFLVNSIRPETYILPGHGPHTNMFHETRHSPYLHAAMS